MAAVLLGVLLAGYKGAAGIASVRSSQGAEKETEDEEAMEQYEAAKAAYENQIRMLGSMISDNSSYKEDSILLNLGANGYFSANSVYYINVSPEELFKPGMAYSDTDYAHEVIQNYIDNVANAYTLYIYSSECLNYVQQKLTDNISLRNLKDLINVSQNSGILNVQVVGDTSKRVDEIMAALDEALSLYKDKVESGVYAHEFKQIEKTKADKVSESEVESSSVTGIDGKTVSTEAQTAAGYVQTKQLDFSSTQNNLINQYETIKDKYSKLTEPSKSGSGTSLKGVLKSCIKFGMIGGFVGLFLAAGIICVNAIFVDAVNTASEVNDYFGVRVFGDYKSRKSSGKFGDMLYKATYGDATSDKEDFLKVFAANIDAYVHAFKDKQVTDVAFVGRLDTSDMKEMVEAVNTAKGSELIAYAGDILTDAEAINFIKDKKYAIVAVDRKTPKRDLRKQLEKLKGLDKTVIGAVLYD